MSQQLDALLIGFPNNPFKTPMSKKGRVLLNGILEHCVKHSSTNIKKVANPSTVFIRAFIEKYDPLIYEEACHKYDAHQLTTLINKYSPKSLDELVGLALLNVLSDQSWVNNNSLKVTTRVGSFAHDKTKQIYRWLTSNYLLTDFSEFDLNKIAQMGSEDFSFEVVKDEANKIRDDDKKNVSYLYAIVVDVTARSEVVRDREKIIDRRYEDKLRSLFAESDQPKKQHQFVDRKAEWDREREYLDTLADLDIND